MKTCTACLKVKSEKEFYWNSHNKQHGSWCKKCTSNKSKLRYKKNANKILDRVKKYAQTKDAKKLRSLRSKKYEAIYVENGMRRAKAKVKWAVSNGLLYNLKMFYVKCVDCGSRATEYDHRDYNYPLLVDPVCHPCNLKRGKGVPLKRSNGIYVSILRNGIPYLREKRYEVFPRKKRKEA